LMSYELGFLEEALKNGGDWITPRAEKIDL
jgi:hypothetical protein